MTIVTNSSVSGIASSEIKNFSLEISRGNIDGLIGVTQTGRNPDVDIGAEDIWAVGGTWVAPTTARIHNMVSTSASDAAAGVGLRTVRVYGLDSNYALAEETVTLNGVTPVATASSYVMIYRLIGLTAGSSATNVGTISATAVTDATVTAQIVIGQGQSQLAVYMIPAGYTGYITGFSGSYNGAPTSNVDIALFVKPFGGIYNLKGDLTLDSTANNSETIEFNAAVKAKEKSIVKLTAMADANNCNVSGIFDLILVPN